MSKMFRLSMLIVTLVFGITVIGCDSGSSSGGGSSSDDLVGMTLSEPGCPMTRMWK